MDPKFMSIQPVTAPVIGVQGITQSTVQGQQWGLPNPNVAVTQSVDLIVASQIGELKQTAHLVDSADTLQSAQQWSHPTQPIANIATTPLNQQWGQSIQPINISATAPFNQLRGPTQPLIGPTTSTAQQWNQPIQLIAPQLNQHSLPIQPTQPSQSNQLVQLSAQLAKSTQQLWNQPNQPTIAQGQGWVVPPATVVPSTLVSNNQPQWGQTAALNQSIPSQQQCGQPSQQWNQLTQQMQSNWSQSPQPQQWNQSPTQLGQWNTQGQQNWNQSTSCSNWNQPMNQQQNWGQTNQQSAFNQPLPQPLNAQTLAAQVSQQYYSVGDMKLKDAVDRIYLKYDSNHSGSLEANEAMPAFNELLVDLSIPAVLNSSECMELLKLVDRDKNGRIEKPEFFACMKNLASRQF